MKKLSILLCLFLLSCSNDKETIVVQYSDSSGVELLSSPIFESIEIVTLRGEGAPDLSPWAKMLVKNDTCYITGEAKIHLFDANGKYLNSVGERGRGPAEYLSLDDMIIEDHGEISVYSNQSEALGVLYTYSPQGRFLRRTELPYKPLHFFKAEGFNYHYFGHGGSIGIMPYQLYITDNQNRLVDSCLTSSDVINLGIGTVFSPFGDALNLCPAYGGEVYRLTGGRVQIIYTFHFGAFHLPELFYKKDYMESYEFIESTPLAFKIRFFENPKYAVLLTWVVNPEQEWTRWNYGVLDKATATWKWYFMKEGDFMDDPCLSYMDDSYVYFTVDPIKIKESGLSERFPLLEAIDIYEDLLVILKCKLK